MAPALTVATITDDLAFYLKGEAQALSQRDTFAIRNYIDREAFNPEVTAYLASPAAAAMLGEAPAGQEPAQAAMSFDLVQEQQLALRFPTWLRFRFRRFTALVQKAFCSVATTLGDTDLQTIIKAVLTALIPVFGAGGVPGIVGSIVIGLAALLLKGGIEAACPA